MTATNIVCRCSSISGKWCFRAASTRRDGQGPRMPATQLHHKAHRICLHERGDVSGQVTGGAGQAYYGHEHGLAATRHCGDVGNLAGVEPPDLGVKALQPGDHPRKSCPQWLELQRVSEGGQHVPSPLSGTLTRVGVHSPRQPGLFTLYAVVAGALTPWA